MRDGIDSGTLALLATGRYTVHKRVHVWNGSGTPISIDGRYYGGSFTAPNPYAPIPKLTLNLIRETDYINGTDSLAPFVEESSFNRLDDNVTFSPLLEVARLVTLEIALTAVGGARPVDASPLWYEVFRGDISKVDWPEMDGHKATLHCIGQGTRLQKSKSEGVYVYPAGTSIENTAQGILDNNGFSSETVVTPVATGKVLIAPYGPGIQKTIWDQLTATAQSIGYSIWYRYQSNGVEALTLFEPDRDKVVSDFTVPFLSNFRELTINHDEIGNVARAIYTGLDGVRRYTAPVEDTASINRYGGVRRSYWINFPEDSPVRSDADAVAVLNLAIKDTANPDAIASAPIPFNPFIEAAVDLITFPEDKRFFTGSLTLAPFDIAHEFSVDSEDVTIVRLRGKPSAGYKTWKSGPAGVEVRRPRPFFTTFRQVEGSTNLVSDLNVLVTDTMGRDGRLTVWLNKDESGNADPEGDPDGYVDLVDLPVTVDASTVFQPFGAGSAGTYFNDVRVHPGQGKDIFLEFVTTDGVSSGKHRYVLRGPGGIVDEDNVIVDGAITSVTQFGPNVTAIAHAANEAALSSLPTAAAVAVVDGELWRKQSDNSWSKGIQSVDIVGDIVATTVANGSLTTAHFASGIEPVSISTAASLPTTKTTELLYWGDDKKLYTWNSTEGAYEEYIASVGTITTVNTENIANEAVTAAKIGEAAVTTVKIALAAVTEALVAAGAITEAKIGAGAVTAAKIGAAAVQTANIANAAVTGALIAANAIGNSHLGDGSVSLTKFASGLTPIEIVATLPTVGNYTGRTVLLTTNSKIYRYNGTAFVSTVPTTDLTGTIGSAQIASGAVGVSALADGAVSLVKFASGLRPVEVLSALPGTGNTQGRTVLLTTDNKIYRYTGSVWTAAVPTTDLSGTIATAQIADAAINAAKIGAAAVQTGNIAAAAITAALIQNGAITADKIEAGAITTVKFAAGIRPVEIVATLPTTGNFVGRVVVLTTDSKLYRYNGTAFTSVVPTTDLTGTISSGQIADAAVTAAKLGSAAVQTANIASEAITTALVAAGAITTTTIADDAITTAKITAGAITAAEIATNAITAIKILAGAVTAGKIAAGAVTATEIAANTITSGQIAASAITSSEIAANAVTAGKVAANAITAGTIAANAVTAGTIAAGVITATEIAAGAVTTAKIAAGAITAIEIAAGAITTAKIAAGAITTIELAAGAVTTGNLAAESVTSARLATGAVTSGKIAAGAVTAGSIAADTITAAQIAAGAIGASEIAADAVTAVKIAAGSITTAKIAAGAVTANELAANSVIAGKIAAGAVTATEIAANAITSNKLLIGQSSNLIPNGDFRTGNTSGWNLWAAPTSIAVADRSDTAVTLGAPTPYILRFQRATSATVGIFTHTEAYNGRPDGVPVVPGQQYRITLQYAEEAGTTASQQVRVYYFLSNDTVSSVNLGTLTGSTVWQTFSVTFTVPENAVKMHFYLYSPSMTGTIYWAQVVVQLVVSSVLIEDGAITATKIATDSVTASAILAGSITTAKIEAGAVTTATIATGAVTANELAANSVTAVKILAGAVTAGKIAADAVTASNIVAGTITATELATGAVTAIKIAANAVTTAALNALAVTADKVAANAITADKIAANAVTATKILAGQISASHMVANTITAGQIATGAIGADEIAANAVTTVKLAAEAVTAAKIAALTITAAQIAADTITGSKIAANTITASELAADSVTAAAILAGTITGDKIAANTITASKIAIGFTAGAALNSDPNTTDIGAWYSDAGAGQIVSVTDSTSGTTALRSVGTSHHFALSTSLIPIDHSKAYRARAWYCRRATANGSFYLIVSLWDGAGNLINGDGTYWFYPVANGVPLVNTWTLGQGLFGYGTSRPFPSNARTMRIGGILNYNGSVGYYEMQDVRLEEVLPATLIQDGAITTAKVAANAITADKISVSDLSAINANFSGIITSTGEIQATDFTADVIGVGGEIHLTRGNSATNANAAAIRWGPGFGGSDIRLMPNTASYSGSTPDLYVEYLTIGGTWTRLATFAGGSPATNMSSLTLLFGTGSSRTIQYGAADSGGVGYRMLRIGN